MWQNYSSNYNAYLNTDTNNENVNYSNTMKSKTKRSKIQKPKKKIKRRPGSSIRSVRSGKSRNSKCWILIEYILELSFVYSRFYSNK